MVLGVLNCTSRFILSRVTSDWNHALRTLDDKCLLARTHTHTLLLVGL